MINPLNRGNTADKIAVYKAEPYVVAADVYAEPKHKGRGGWTWYTGSAAWMYQLILESFIGLKREGDKLVFKPCMPEEWPSVKIQYRNGGMVHQIELKQEENDGKLLTTLIVDGVVQPELTYLLSSPRVVPLLPDSTTEL